jgi:hypothetical protein
MFGTGDLFRRTYVSVPCSSRCAQVKLFNVPAGMFSMTRTASWSVTCRFSGFLEVQTHPDGPEPSEKVSLRTDTHHFQGWKSETVWDVRFPLKVTVTRKDRNRGTEQCRIKVTCCILDNQDFVLGRILFLNIMCKIWHATTLSRFPKFQAAGAWS